jgi:hypothetical protein
MVGMRQTQQTPFHHERVLFQLRKRRAQRHLRFDEPSQAIRLAPDAPRTQQQETPA